MLNTWTVLGCAWGLFDKEGKRDQLGTLNLLTPEVVLEAKKEIQTGVSVALSDCDDENGV